MKSLALFGIVLSLLTTIEGRPSLSSRYRDRMHPPHSSRSKELAPAFKIIISTPSLPMLVPIYLTSNGSTTTDKLTGALCYIRSSTELYCGNKTVPIGAPLGAPASLFSAVRASEQAAYVGMGGGPLVTKGFSVKKETLKVRWENMDFGSEVEFVYRLDGSQTIWAVFENATMVDSVGADLVAVFE